MKRLGIVGVAITFAIACGEDGPDPYDIDFSIPRTESFEQSLLAYNLFELPLATLKPASDVTLYELSSELFTDYAYKQRLLRLPGNSVVTQSSDGRLNYPDGSIMVKTFYYPEDMRVADGERRIIETRLLVRREGQWNMATYLWNEAQTDATLLLEGTTTQVSWIDTNGDSRSTNYEVPNEGECVTCHQTNNTTTYIGPSVQNLNRLVSRDAVEIGQLEYLTKNGFIEAKDWPSSPAVPNYKDSSRSMEERARAYLHINCSHCHNPDGWEEAAETNLDLRYDTTTEDTGLAQEINDLRRLLESGEMPYLGTTMLHDEGIELVLQFAEGL